MFGSLSAHWRPIAVVIAIALAVWVAALIAIPKLAFGRDKVAQALGDAVSGQAHFHSFRNVYFPHPGCVAEGVTIQRGSDQRVPPLIFISRLSIVGSYSTLLSKRVSWMKAEGLVVRPSGDTWPENRSTSSIVIEHFVTENAILQLYNSGGGVPVKFAVHHLMLDGLGSDQAMPFEVTLANFLPPGEISSRGKLGPWDRQHENTPIEGSYSFRDADLSALGGVAGILSSDGKFRGSIHQLEISGSTEAPQFEITSNHHRFPLSTQFQAQVDATNGNVILQNVHATLANTSLDIHGAVVPDRQKRRTATLDVIARNGHIEDILYPFIHAPRSPIHGVTSWQAHIVLPSGDETFRRKVQLDGSFGIADAQFTDPQTQAKLDKASEQARGKPDDPDPADVVSDLKGHVLLKNGSADFSQLSFTVPGAWAQMHGRYNILTEHIDLHGTVRLQAKMSNATSGIKSFLLKAISPFIKNDKPQEPLPIAITGTYHHPQYSISVTKKNKQHAFAQPKSDRG